MKTIGKNIADIAYAEPRCFLGWLPTRPDETGLVMAEPLNVVPGIVIMPTPSKVKFMEEKRFDRYNNVHRPAELGQTLAISMLFSVYEAGIRLPGFIDTEHDEHGLDMTLLLEGTQEGLFTLFDWMDDAREKLLGIKHIPGTDMFLSEESMSYSLYSDAHYVIDKRPVFYGFLNIEFGCYAHEGANPLIDDLLNN